MMVTSLTDRVVDFGIIDCASIVVLANITLDNFFVVAVALVRLVVIVDVRTLRISHGALSKKLKKRYIQRDVSGHWIFEGFRYSKPLIP